MAARIQVKTKSNLIFSEKHIMLTKHVSLNPGNVLASGEQLIYDGHCSNP
jgi:hypothetical protein